jgi:hypothetical protein
MKDAKDLRERLVRSIKSNEGVDGSEVAGALPPKSRLGRAPCEDGQVRIDGGGTRLCVALAGKRHRQFQT